MKQVRWVAGLGTADKQCKHMLSRESAKSFGAVIFFFSALSSIFNPFQAGLDTGSVFFLRGSFYSFCRIDGFTYLPLGLSPPSITPVVRTLRSRHHHKLSRAL